MSSEQQCQPPEVGESSKQLLLTLLPQDVGASVFSLLEVKEQCRVMHTATSIQTMIQASFGRYYEKIVYQEDKTKLSISEFVQKIGNLCYRAQCLSALSFYNNDLRVPIDKEIRFTDLDEEDEFRDDYGTNVSIPLHVLLPLRCTPNLTSLCIMCNEGRAALEGIVPNPIEAFPSLKNLKIVATDAEWSISDLKWLESWKQLETISLDFEPDTINFDEEMAEALCNVPKLRSLHMRIFINSSPGFKETFEAYEKLITDLPRNVCDIYFIVHARGTAWSRAHEIGKELIAERQPRFATWFNENLGLLGSSFYTRCFAMCTTCPNMHELTELTTPFPGFGCNACGATLPAGSLMYGCRRCNFDQCDKCYNDRTRLCTCGTRKLIEFAVPNSEQAFSCKKCERSFIVGEKVYGCRACAQDVCIKCL